MVEIVPLALGDILELKKSHACGANEWEVTRLGMDVGLKCSRCGRRITLPRGQVDRRFRSYLKRVMGPGGPEAGADAGSTGETEGAGAQAASAETGGAA